MSERGCEVVSGLFAGSQSWTKMGVQGRGVEGGDGCFYQRRGQIV